jgi:periplasmic divalent cation tolerance protein
MAAAARNFRIVFVMAGSEDEAGRIANTLVEERLAACVNIIGPARSIYRWQGAVENASEYLLLIKTHSRHFRKLERRVTELHSYEVPEIVATALVAGFRSYLEWLADSTRPAPRRSAEKSRRRRLHA